MIESDNNQLKIISASVSWLELICLLNPFQGIIEAFSLLYLERYYGKEKRGRKSKKKKFMRRKEGEMRDLKKRKPKHRQQ